jgi:GT2 family glycosyltransferase/peptidoglycan/xylan/chitin deacetylase (PgdA/CDA1 family)
MSHAAWPDGKGAGVPRLSVVVPTYQRRDLVRGLLHALARQDTHEPFEAVVVVDGSTDGTAAALRCQPYPFPLAVLHQPNRGAARARNRGVDHARGEVVLFLDDDMEPDPGLIRTHLEAHEAGAQVVMGAMPLHPESPDNIMAESVGQWADELAAQCAHPGYQLGPQDVFTGHMSIRRDLFHSLGGFDERFTANGTFGNEDLDFGHRLAVSGSSMVFRADAISYQRYTVSAREFLPRFTQVGEADMAVARLHHDLPPTLRPFSLRASSPSPLARLVVGAPGLARVAVAPLRWVAVRLVDGGRKDGLTRRLYAKVRLVHYWLGVAAAGGPVDGATVRVLCWHAITDLSDDWVLRDYGVSPAIFSHQLSALRRAGWAFLTIEEYLRFVHQRAPVPRRCVLLTFDDCYTDLATDALPVVKEHEATAAVFAVSARIGDCNRWDLHLGARPLPLATRQALLGLVEAGLEVGAHSRTHPPLTQLDDQSLRDEIVGSRQELADLGLPVPRVFAYPHGAHDRRVRETVRAAGFHSAFSITPGKASRDGLDPFAVPRMEVLPDDVGRSFLRKVRRGGPRTGFNTRTVLPRVRSLLARNPTLVRLRRAVRT